MEAIYSIARTIADAEEKIVVGTLFSNVQQVVMQMNEVIKVMNGSQFLTGGIGNMGVTQWAFNHGQLGVAPLYVDENYREELMQTINYYKRFVHAVCETEMCLESQRGGAMMQSAAMQALQAVKFKNLSYDYSENYIKQWALQKVRVRTAYSSRNPYVVPELNTVTYRRSQPAMDDVAGTRVMAIGDTIKFAVFDQDFARTEPGQMWESNFEYNMPVPISDATIQVDTDASGLLNDQILITNTYNTTWLYAPFQVPLTRFTIEFYNTGNLVYQIVAPGMHCVPTFNSIVFRLRIVRPAVLSQHIQQYFPAQNPGNVHATVAISLRIKSCVTDVVLADPDSTYYARITNVRTLYGIPVGPVFPPNMAWDTIVRDYSASRQDNMQRLMTIAAIDCMLSE
nr:inner capsid protein [Rotavirus F]UMZ07349.2 inner capsid protein [Rotavirus F]UMZ07352.2 inner capsid protein [Rotavirus F]